MKFNTFIIIILICLFCFSKDTLSNENKILVKVNDEIITTIDILNEIRFLSTVNKKFEEIEKNQKILIAKNSLIKDKIKMIELLKFKENLVLNENDYKNIVNNYFNNTEEESVENYKLFLKKNNLDEAHLREKLSVDTYWKGYIYQKFYKNVKINKAEIMNAILKKEKQYEYMLSEIVFTLENNENLSEKQNEINKVIKEKSFAEAALKYSISDSARNGGKLGWIPENILSNTIKDEIKKINKDEFTKPIVIPGGLLILKKENTREIKNNLNKDEELKIAIEKKTNDQLDKFSNIYLNKLRKNIQINEI